MKSNHKSREMFVISQDVIDSILKTIRDMSSMRKETSDVYYQEEIRIYRQPQTDVWWVGIYGPNDRRTND